MGSQDIERAFYIKKLFDKQMDKVDPKKSYRERCECAMKAMDQKMGKEWRSEMQIDGDDKMDAAEAMPFYLKLDMEGDAEGLGTKGTEAPDEEERPVSFKDKIMKRIGKMLDEVL